MYIKTTDLKQRNATQLEFYSTDQAGELALTSDVPPYQKLILPKDHKASLVIEAAASWSDRAPSIPIGEYALAVYNFAIVKLLQLQMAVPWAEGVDQDCGGTGLYRDGIQLRYVGSVTEEEKRRIFRVLSDFRPMLDLVDAPLANRLRPIFFYNGKMRVEYEREHSEDCTFSIVWDRYAPAFDRLEWELSHLKLWSDLRVFQPNHDEDDDGEY